MESSCKGGEKCLVAAGYSVSGDLLPFFEAGEVTAYVYDNTNDLQESKGELQQCLHRKRIDWSASKGAAANGWTMDSSCVLCGAPGNKNLCIPSSEPRVKSWLNEVGNVVMKSEWE